MVYWHHEYNTFSYIIYTINISRLVGVGGISGLSEGDKQRNVSEMGIW